MEIITKLVDTRKEALELFKKELVGFEPAADEMAIIEGAVEVAVTKAIGTTLALVEETYHLHDEVYEEPKEGEVPEPIPALVPLELSKKFFEAVNN